jgi:excisionase family DNA binding protein
MDMKRGDRLLTITEAADMLGLKRDTLRRQARNGVLRAEHVGSVWIVTEREVVRYRREHLGKVGPKPGSKRRKKPEPTETGASPDGTGEGDVPQ